MAVTPNVTVNHADSATPIVIVTQKRDPRNLIFANSELLTKIIWLNHAVTVGVTQGHVSWNHAVTRKVTPPRRGGGDGFRA